MQRSNLADALTRLGRRGASAVVARSRVASPGLNAALLARLSVAPGQDGALLADPVFEAAKRWRSAPVTLGDLAGGLLSPDLVAALDRAQDYRMPRSLQPWQHQLDAWQACLGDGKSALVTSGTGSGKTECFLIPILNDILTNRRTGGGIRAILLYPLNALIESQRERLSAWAAGLDGRVRFALYNGDTPETPRRAGEASSRWEVTNRRDLRANPPDILVTNITMLEYLLLREKDRALLDASQGALRWIVLDEAHSYIGSQAAEMALLLRRVRAAFGAAPQSVRLMATSATIGGEEDAETRLAEFAAALAGQPRDRIAVVAGQEDHPDLGPPGPDLPLDPASLDGLAPEALWGRLAGHPRVQAVRQAMAQAPVSLSAVAAHLWGDRTRRADAQTVLDAAAQAARGDHRLLPWRAHLFHRAQGGVWACIDPACPQRSPELLAEGAAWPFGAIHLAPQASCGCGAPIAEVTACRGCGTPHLRARLLPGAQPRLEAAAPEEGDDFALDAEPEGAEAAVGALIASAQAQGPRVWVGMDGLIFDNAPPGDDRAVALTLFEQADQRLCCAGAAEEGLQDLRFGPAFFLGNALPQALEDLAEPDGTRTGLPAGGRKAISFSDSRQGVARLAAKLQQEAERTLTRSFLYHAVQEAPSGGDPSKLAELDAQIAALKQIGAQGPLAGVLAGLEADRDRLAGVADSPLPWPDLVARFAAHHDLNTFAGEVWRPRAVGNRIWDKPEDLARTFLFRELFRRPRVQNNPETMGLVRLVFPELEQAIRRATLPEPLRSAGPDAAVGLALTAVDAVFRNALAVQIPDWMVPIVSPRFGRLNTIHPALTPKEDRPRNSRLWPSSIALSGRMSLLASHVYRLIDGDPAQPLHQDRAEEVLAWLWQIMRRVCVDAGGGGLRLDFDKAALVRVDQAWLCPLTRRPIGHSVGGRSPNDPARGLVEVRFPRLPLARAAGLTAAERQTLRDWTEAAPEIRALRERGLWSDMHDRIAAFPPFIRSQEHSAQIPRAVLKTYEARFNTGEINLLNCSTTMEMGVDLAAVWLVVNANVPPALSNYRQRVGRAGRRREPWAFGLTFCRDLPLDWLAFRNPAGFLERTVAAPKVWLDSAPLVQRHVNAALLSRWFAERGGMNIKADTGSFLGAVVDGPRPESAEVDRFLADLAGPWAEGDGISTLLHGLVAGTILQDQPQMVLVAQTVQAMDRLVIRWRTEFDTLLARRDGTEEEVAQALTLRARRMAGEFLLGDLARRGFTPAYGFPTDVVSFLPLGRRDDDGPDLTHRARGASRELHQAIREYAPGSEIVIDGLVWQSEGVLPAWGAESDASRLEDLRSLWECSTCHGFGITSLDIPTACPDCGALTVGSMRILRPAGFLTRKSPHTGYEALAHSPFMAPRTSAAGAGWTALPDAAVGRMRHDPEGLVVTRASGKHGGGFAICLDCGRAEPMERPQPGLDAPLPEAMRRHYPLARGKGLRLTADGFCPGGYTAPHRVQRGVHLAQSSRTDVFELQLPAAPGVAAALALAAALREALAGHLGIESDEIGVAAGRSGAFAEGGTAKAVSLWLHDRAAGGAGLVARLREADVLVRMIEAAAERLDCPESCAVGCPACILQPDLSQEGLALDRVGALNLARGIAARLHLPEALKVWGAQTRYLGGALIERIESLRRAGDLDQIVVPLHGSPSDWDLPGWVLGHRLAALADAGVKVRLMVRSRALTDAGFDLGVKLSLYRLGGHAEITHVPDLPRMGGLAVAAWLRGVGGDWRGVALQSEAEAVPGADWAEGALAPTVIGPAAAPDTGQAISLQRLMRLGTGTGHVLTPGAALDGAANGFGLRFWKWLGGFVPLEIQAMQAVGLARVAYTDRYLVTPITLLLLAEVLRAMPGAAKAALRIDLAPADLPRRDNRTPEPSRLFDGYGIDSQRRAVLQALLPQADIRLAASKGDLPHRRELVFDLADGRRFRLLFDQGFGAWRARGVDIKHDFLADPATQARRLLRLSATVHGEPEPLVWDGGANPKDTA